MEFNISITGSAIQSAGALLITILTFFLLRFISRPFLKYWAFAWLCLLISLSSLTIAFRLRPIQSILLIVYYIFEYAFCFLIYAGCKNYSAGKRLSKRDFRSFAFLFIFGVVLGLIPIHYNYKFLAHFFIIGGLFYKSYKVLIPSKSLERKKPGFTVMSIGLALLSFDFFHYIPIFAYALFYAGLPFPYLDYSPIYDLLLELFLGFGMVMVVMEDIQQEVIHVNHQLMQTRDQLESLARRDPLTEALNRHAFYSLVDKQSPELSIEGNGCVAVIDIDNLKPLNDCLGHAAGDAAIREVAKCLRSIIRADDMLFRWGGDEFLIIMFNITEGEVKNRLTNLRLQMDMNHLSDLKEPIPLMFSFGVTPFSNLDEIEGAIDQADTLMYSLKQQRKTLLAS
ncbi:MAG: GGDEF domain-containing protein [Acidobacteriota bacterium]